MKRLIKFGLKPWYRKYTALVARISNLETAIDCLIDSPRWTPSDAVGFNGQRHRKLIFHELLNAFNFEAILETGTWIGNTTGYMATESALPVHTCEINPRFHTLARMRLQGMARIDFTLADSRSFLQTISRTDVAAKRVFVYLDAHWYDDLPLREEIEIISGAWQEYVIMVDDFEVPSDSGYGYDRYEKHNVLSMEFFADTFARCGLIPFFPSLPSAEETGARRGCVVLAGGGRAAEVLGGLASLVRKPS